MLVHITILHTMIVHLSRVRGIYAKCAAAVLLALATGLFCCSICRIARYCFGVFTQRFGSDFRGTLA